MKSPSSAYVDDRRQELAGDRVVETEERAAEQDVVAARQLLVEAGAQGQQARRRGHDTRPTPSDGWMIPARTCRSVLLPAPFGPMTASDSPRWTCRSTWRSAQNLLARAAPQHLPERVAEASSSG